MKEMKTKKQTKKKPGEFKKQQKKHQNIQHNRDQMKALREGFITQAELFVLDPDGFKKVTVVPFVLNDTFSGEPVVYLHNRGRGSKLRTSHIIDKDGFKVSDEPGGHINPEHVIGRIIKVEMLKGKEE